jgi:DNA-binding NtrC family response regulator
MFFAPPELKSKRVLIVEDEFQVALLLEEILIEFGCIPIGPFGTVMDGLGAIENKVFDVAILDVNLNGEWVYPLAERLADRHVPFLFVSGYGDKAIPRDHTDWRVCAKPFTAADLATMLSAVLEDGV